jgi:hypothetical protein
LWVGRPAVAVEEAPALRRVGEKVLLGHQREVAQPAAMRGRQAAELGVLVVLAAANAVEEWQTWRGPYLSPAGGWVLRQTDGNYFRVRCGEDNEERLKLTVVVAVGDRLAQRRLFPLARDETAVVARVLRLRTDAALMPCVTRRTTSGDEAARTGARAASA